MYVDLKYYIVINKEKEEMKQTKKLVNILFMVIMPVVIFYTMEWFLRNPFEKCAFLSSY